MVTEPLALSIVIPVYNEARTLVDLHQRLVAVLKNIGQPWEILFIDDGSTDGSASILKALHAQNPAVRVVRFNRNYGQHTAVFAGLERARGATSWAGGARGGTTPACAGGPPRW
jgi:undecaprenyl-phosphate 4-deoxy-4-formamido-L-arabinose transferase